MDHRQTISIYRSRKTGAFRLQPFGRLPNGSSQPFGEVEQLPTSATNDQLTTAVVRNLAKNDHQLYDEALAPRLSLAEQKREFKEDQLISVYREGSQYRIIPFKRMGNSFGSVDDMIQVVPGDEFFDRGGDMIKRLFDEMP